MKIGIGIDTGGTCTDAVVYQFEEKKVLAYAKTHTTKDDLARGIGRALERLPRELVDQAEVIALSTTLATNACVENKGGRAKLVMFGINPVTVQKTGHEYGLTMDDTLVFVNSKTKIDGKIVEPPNWEEFEGLIEKRFGECDALGVVEMFAKKTGAVLEKKATELVHEKYNIPIVCGHELFSEYNIVKRGASTLLNARLISIIEEFTAAVKRALKELKIDVPFVIVRSDGSLMTEKFAQVRPIETLLCGPVASVMGAVELSNEQNSMIVDIGGTTTDIAFVKNGVPKRVSDGVKIGNWSTFVKGLFVDTFGLGGDSGVIIVDETKVGLEDEKVMPLCMAAARYPSLVQTLERIEAKQVLAENVKHEIYLGVKDIRGNENYTELERNIVSMILNHPMSLEEVGNRLNTTVLKSQLERLVRETIIIRCGVTPTDIMHCKGDFDKYDVNASKLGVSTMARILRVSPEELGDMIYDEFKRKLYLNIVRIIIEDANPAIREQGIGEQMELLINESYEQAKAGKATEFLGVHFNTPCTLVGVGAPTHIFLGDVGKLLNAKVVSSEYSMVANALGAIVGNVCAKVTMEITMNQDSGTYVVFGGGERFYEEDLEKAKTKAKYLAETKAREEAVARGAKEDAKVDFEEEENIVDTDFGPLYMGYKITATATGELDLQSLKEAESKMK